MKSLTIKILNKLQIDKRQLMILLTTLGIGILTLSRLLATQVAFRLTKSIIGI